MREAEEGAGAGRSGDEETHSRAGGQRPREALSTGGPPAGFGWAEGGAAFLARRVRTRPPAGIVESVGLGPRLGSTAQCLMISRQTACPSLPSTSAPRKTGGEACLACCRQDKRRSVCETPRASNLPVRCQGPAACRHPGRLPSPSPVVWDSQVTARRQGSPR